MRISFVALLIIFLAACSSIKQPNEPPSKQDADSMLHMAQDLENMHQSKQAKESYQFAMDLYNSHAGIEGQLACLSGLGRLALGENDPSSYQNIVSRMLQIVGEIAPQYEYHVLLLNLFELQGKKDFAGISAIAVLKPEYPPSVKLQLATAKLQADSYLKQATAVMATDLATMAKAYSKTLRKRTAGNPELLSAAWYALAYYYFTTFEYTQALDYLAKVTDLDYRYGNNSGLGHAFWLQGQVERMQHQGDKALASLRKAELIFGTLNDEAALGAVAQEIVRLKGEKP